jgi:hypothetical protein
MLTLLLQRLVLVVVLVYFCKNSSAMLFVAKYPSTLCYLKVESATDRVLNMVSQMDAEGFGNCTNTGLVK